MKKVFFLFIALLAGEICMAQTKVQHLQTENLPNPISVDATAPRFSWQLIAGDARNVMQTAYEIKVTNTAKGVVWSTGKVLTDQSMYVTYKGTSLTSGQKYTWQVRVWDNKGKTSQWSTATFQMGLLSPADWKAQWIAASGTEEPTRPSPLFRKGFSVNKKIKSAMAYITSHGLYEAHINGHRVGDEYLTPGYTSYNKRLQYQAYDVTGLLQPGTNAVGASLGSGWYRGFYGIGDRHEIYGKDIALLLQLEITYTDGTKTIIGTDDSWKTSTGEIRSAEIYLGSVTDNRLQQKGWSSPGFDDKNWTGVTVQNYPKNNLIATINEPVKKHETFKALKIFTTPKGEKVIDFGQNLVGWVKFKVHGKAGDKIVISHAEVIDKAGNFYTENLRSATSQNTFILKGDGEETFEPQFTWQGFRFIRIEGYPGDIKPEDFTAIALYSDMPATGSFTCSNPMINQLQHNIQWGQKGNFLDIPTDCPQRDERLGWTGDAQVFSRTATYNMNAHNFFAKWLKDVALDQFSDGSVPHVIPDAFDNGHPTGGGGSAGWSDVATIVPWNMYLAYGDKEILANQYNSMKAWIGFMKSRSHNNLWNAGDHFGDWLFYTRNNDVDGTSAITSKYLIAQCFYAYSTQLVINTAKVLGKSDDVATYTKLLADVKSAYLREYVTPNGLISSDTQTAYALALQFDMLPENLRQQAAARLAANIGRYGNHLTTGFLGTPYLCSALSRFGYSDVAFKLLLQDSYPSWLYPVKMGATTIWERWDGQKTDGTFEDAGMNSFNHYAYGAIGDWMYRTVAGIDTKGDQPGYKGIIIKPTIGGNLTTVAADYETPYGKASSHWKADNGQLTLDVVIPPNTTATIYVPTKGDNTVTEGGKPVTKAATQIEGYTAVNVGSGNYHFSTSL
ncbi:glycoside hydrolase family 78 protein [Mucilaginibacter sp. UR6-11]|uniref:glycoside hydrolase family 78 protein n=1 Tax=Mucilaginibacter sp. UR6-11 TaxID=1435644 RepID=UPI001E4AF7C2|nr:glycoside hydrolase family 78 protein [Mucilaginibacter sp. UR6-11]MCC8427109.1 glycoside hydrolase family 78 protein [Mucilaginibacter sp. UR6-11]